ncbi:hypothetical protein [Laspinema olomoucense]|nr:hypothetical protein [Laspinema sp. D3a]
MQPVKINLGLNFESRYIGSAATLGTSRLQKQNAVTSDQMLPHL